MLFPLFYAQGEASIVLALAGAGDGVLALVFIAYAWWLNAERGSSAAFYEGESVMPSSSRDAGGD